MRAGQDGGEAGLKQVCADVAEVLNNVATSEDEDNDREQPSPPSAPNRFAAAVQASLGTGLPPASRCCNLYATPPIYGPTLRHHITSH